MGYNTTMNIINDGMDQIRKYPDQFVEGLLKHYNDGGTIGVGNHANVAQVAESKHADVFRLFGVQGNSLIELSLYSRETEEIAERLPDLIRSFIEQARRELDDLEASLPIHDDQEQP